MTIFKVYDSLGNCLKSFPTYQAAITYKIMCCRHDWIIKKFTKY